MWIGVSIKGNMIVKMTVVKMNLNRDEIPLKSYFIPNNSLIKSQFIW